MKRATISIPEDLEQAVTAYISAQEAPPPLTAIVAAALREYLAERGYLPATRTLRISPARKGSGRRDVSRAHDRYLARK